MVILEEGSQTKSSVSESSGISVSFAPWCLGMTSCFSVGNHQLNAGSGRELGCLNGMSFAQRANVEESKGLVALEELEARDFPWECMLGGVHLGDADPMTLNGRLTLDNAAKDAGHGEG